MARKRLSTKKFVINRDEVFDQKRNGDLTKELKVEPVDETLRRYKSNWLQGHVTRMNNRIPKIMLNFKPNRGRQLGTILKRVLDEADTDLTKLNSWLMVVVMVMLFTA
jgi:hypothetical protein